MIDACPRAGLACSDPAVGLRLPTRRPTAGVTPGVLRTGSDGPHLPDRQSPGSRHSRGLAVSAPDADVRRTGEGRAEAGAVARPD